MLQDQVNRSQVQKEIYSAVFSSVKTMWRPDFSSNEVRSNAESLNEESGIQKVRKRAIKPTL